MEHMESIIQGHFDEDNDRALTRAEWDTIYRCRLSKEGISRTWAPPVKDVGGGRAQIQSQGGCHSGDAAANTHHGV